MVTIEGSIYTSALFLVALIGARVSSLRFRGSRLMGTVVAAFGTPALAWATDTVSNPFAQGGAFEGMFLPGVVLSVAIYIVAMIIYNTMKK